MECRSGHGQGRPGRDIGDADREAYEAKHFEIPAPDPIAAVEFMLQQKGLTRRDLEPAIGSRGRVSEVMTRKRALTLPMVRALSDLLDIPTDVLVRPYETRRAA